MTLIVFRFIHLHGTISQPESLILTDDDMVISFGVIILKETLIFREKHTRK